MEKNTQEVKEYYDNYVTHQKKIGISIRHRLILKAIKKLKLKKSTNVLEIGCGVGTVSKLLVNHFAEGQFLGCDISEESILSARHFVDASRARFLCTDMSDFSDKEQFDLVVFPDVLEHIPQELHKNIFERIAAVCSSNCVWFVHIPNPEASDNVRKHKPHLLQIIDQALDLSQLISDAKSVGFQIDSLEKYAIHTNAPNYVKLVFRNNLTLDRLENKPKYLMAIQNVLARL